MPNRPTLTRSFAPSTWEYDRAVKDYAAAVVRPPTNSRRESGMAMHITSGDDSSQISTELTASVHQKQPKPPIA